MVALARARRERDAGVTLIATGFKRYKLTGSEGAS